MSAPVRVVQLSGVGPLRSQAVYHALGHAGPHPDDDDVSVSDPMLDTIVLIEPARPYVCIGFHQELDREVDRAACARLGLPIIRREVGGGAVLLDSGQVFANWVFAADRLPSGLQERFRLYATPLVQTYRSFGVDAQFRPVNDIHVAGRKIGGTGAARMGDHELVVGSVMFDFDHATMAQVLRVSSVKMRDKVAQALRDYVTTLRRELGTAPPRADVLKAYLSHCAQALGRPTVSGTLTAAEERSVDRWQQRLASDSWTDRKTRRVAAGVRISADVSVHEVEHKAPGGLIRGTITVRNGRIDDVLISGDFTIEPSTAVETLEQSLRGQPAEPEPVGAKISEWLATVTVPGVRVVDLLAALGLTQNAGSSGLDP